MKEPFHPYKTDIKLLTKLSLPLWESKLGEEIYLGEVFPDFNEKGTSLSIKIWVACMPSQFYRFIVHNTNDDIFCEIKTGSGSLTKYYLMALSVARGNFVIKPLYN